MKFQITSWNENLFISYHKGNFQKFPFKVSNAWIKGECVNFRSSGSVKFFFSENYSTSFEIPKNCLIIIDFFHTRENLMCFSFQVETYLQYSKTEEKRISVLINYAEHFVISLHFPSTLISITSWQQTGLHSIPENTSTDTCHAFCKYSFESLSNVLQQNLLCTLLMNRSSSFQSVW